MIGGHLIKSYSKTQTIVALPSAESEFYAPLKAAQEGRGITALAKDLDVLVKPKIMVDASNALGVAPRLGIGKIRHLQTGALWLQDEELRKVIRLSKVPGRENNSDTITKNVSRELLERHLQSMGGKFIERWAEKAVELNAVEKQVCQVEAEVKGLRS